MAGHSSMVVNDEDIERRRCRSIAGPAIVSASFSPRLSRWQEQLSAGILIALDRRDWTARSIRSAVKRVANAGSKRRELGGRAELTTLSIGPYFAFLFSQKDPLHNARRRRQRGIAQRSLGLTA